MECFVCSKKLDEGFLCEEHAKELRKMLKNREGVVELPDWKYHCLICGEYKDRIIVEYPNCGCFCDKDICDEWSRYSTD